MSLTSMLAGKSEKELEFQEIIKRMQPKKDKFETISGKKAFTSEFEIKAENKLSSPYLSSIVGTTFDYLARFQVAQVIKENKDSVYVGLVAENFFNRFDNALDNKTLKKAKEKYDETIEYIKDFVNSSNEVNEELISYTFYLAILEKSWRSVMLPDDINNIFNEPSKEIEEDLFNLTNEFKESFIKSVVKKDSTVIFNPKFGMVSAKIGGADADIYIDGTLYDFKTSKKPGYVGKDIQQIVGYYLLSEAANREYDIFNKFEGYEISRISIYLARFGEIVYFDINKFDDDLKNKCILDMYNFLKSI